MRALRLLIGLTLICALPASARAKTPLVPAPAPGTLVVRSTTEGAEVFVDGVKVGLVPLGSPLALAPGEHTIKVIRPGFAPLIDVFHVVKHRQTTLDAELAPVAGVLLVTANVDKANVFVDGKFVGVAPLTSEMAVGPRAIQVSKAGFRDSFQNVSSVAGQDVMLDVRLEELPVGLNPYKQGPAAPLKWHEKWWVWTAAAAGAVAILSITLGVVLTRPGDPCDHTLNCFSVAVPASTR